MNVSILTPESQLFEGESQSVKVPGITGGFEILENHAAIVSALGSGSVTIKKTDGSSESYEILNGFIEVLKNNVSILVQTA